MTVASIAPQNGFPSVNTNSSTTSSAETGFDAFLAAAQSTAPQQTATSDDTLLLDTSAGKQQIDLDDYFTPKSGINFDDPTSMPPLLFPSAANIAALSSDASAKFTQFLSDHGIPAAPSKITYGTDGQMQLPADYAYADQLKQALTADPSLARELSTVHALASQFAAMQDSLRFTQAYEATRTPVEAAAVVAKFNYLFSDNRRTPDVALRFSPDGQLSLTPDGRPFNAVAN